MNAITAQRTLYTAIESPIGELLVIGDGAGLQGLHIQRRPRALKHAGEAERDDGAFAEASSQLSEYFAGERTRFDLELEPAGTSFQRRVWSELERIEFGETITYAELARRIGSPGSARAVGAANGRNPISIVVPCHRVIGGDGSLTGYGGGIERKRKLLELEGVSV